MKTYMSNMPEITLKYKTGNYKKTKISTSLDAFQVLLQLYDEDTVDYRETAFVLFLNKANNTILLKEARVERASPNTERFSIFIFSFYYQCSIFHPLSVNRILYIQFEITFLTRFSIGKF